MQVLKGFYAAVRYLQVVEGAGLSNHSNPEPKGRIEEINYGLMTNTDDDCRKNRDFTQNPSNRPITLLTTLGDLTL